GYRAARVIQKEARALQAFNKVALEALEKTGGQIPFRMQESKAIVKKITLNNKEVFTISWDAAGKDHSTYKIFLTPAQMQEATPESLAELMHADVVQGAQHNKSVMDYLRSPTPQH